MEEDGCALFTSTPGAPAQRPGHVWAAAPRTDAIRGEEHALETFALLAVQADARVHLDTARVRQEAVRQLHVPFYELGVTRLSEATFLLRFDNQLQRNAARHHGTLRIGHVGLQLLPWMRQVGARASLSKFRYRARLCIEGLPAHARHAETVASLFPKPSFVDDMECDMEKPEEEECLRLWIWTMVPDEIATTGTLQVEEPVTLPEEGYEGSLVDLGMPMRALRSGPAKTLDYDVIIHVDRIMDYRPLPTGSSHRSTISPISGHPYEELGEEWPARHPFQWRLGVPDGDRRRAPEQRRVSVHERLGDRGRDRSPPRGGGASGLFGVRQVPPSGPHDLPGMRGGNQSNYFHGSSSHHVGGQSQRREMHACGAQWRWQVKGAEGQQVKGPMDANGMVSSLLSQYADGSFHVRETLTPDIRAVDPMLEEAGRVINVGPRQLARSQCSVEPTATNASGGVPDYPAAERNAVFWAGDQPDQVCCEADSVVSIGGSASGFGGGALGLKGDVEHSGCMHAERMDVPAHMPEVIQTQTQTEMGLPMREREAQLQQEKQAGSMPLQADCVVNIMARGTSSHVGAEHVGLESPALRSVKASGAVGDTIREDLATVEMDGTTSNLTVAKMGQDKSIQDGPFGGPVEHGPATRNRELFDLNLGCESMQEFETSSEENAGGKGPVDGRAQRIVLGEADGRLNKDGRQNHKHHARGVARFAVPLKKSLLCNPTVKTKSGGSGPGLEKKSVRKHASGLSQVTPSMMSGEAAGLPKKFLSVPDQATALLMKKSGIIEGDEVPSEEAQAKFREQFIDPLQTTVVGDLRDTFGLSDGGGADLFSAIAIDADA
ncbi:unnamed protein product [Urochloa humidicola]